MPDPRAAVLDACVLVPASLRDTLLGLAEPPCLYRPLWTEEIIAETMRTLEAKIGLPPSKTAYLERELRRHFGESWVTGFQPLLRQMTNDAKDRHVLAAAVKAKAPAIVTFNKRHFPPASTRPWIVEALGPSAFLEELYRAEPAAVVERIMRQAVELRRPVAAQLASLEKTVPSFAEIVRRDLGRAAD